MIDVICPQCETKTRINYSPSLGRCSSLDEVCPACGIETTHIIKWQVFATATPEGIELAPVEPARRLTAYERNVLAAARAYRMALNNPVSHTGRDMRCLLDAALQPEEAA